MFSQSYSVTSLAIVGPIRSGTYTAALKSTIVVGVTAFVLRAVCLHVQMHQLADWRIIEILLEVASNWSWVPGDWFLFFFFLYCCQFVWMGPSFQPKVYIFKQAFLWTRPDWGCKSLEYKRFRFLISMWDAINSRFWFKNKFYSHLFLNEGSKNLAFVCALQPELFLDKIV